MFAKQICRLITTALILSLTLAISNGQSQSSESAKTKLIVGTKHVPPFAIKDTSGSWSGISIELWTMVASDLDLEYEFRELSLEEMLDSLEKGSIDVATAALTITAKRELTMDFTHPFHTSGLGIAVSSKNKAGWLAVMERFLSFTFLKVLLALAIVLFIAGLLVWFFEHKNNVEEFGAKLPGGLGAGFWWSAVTMTTVGYGDKSPKTLGGRLVAIVWMFTSVIIISSFTAAIASSLTVTQLELKVRGPKDLPKVRVASVRGSTSDAYLTSQRITFDRLDSAIEGLKAVEAGKLDAMVYDAPVLRYLISNDLNGTLRVLPQTFERQYYAIGLPQGSELRERINRVLVQRISQPEWQGILQKYLGE